MAGYFIRVREEEVRLVLTNEPDLLGWLKFYDSLKLSLIWVQEKKAVGKWKRIQTERRSIEKLVGEYRLRKGKITGLAVILGSSNLVCLDFESPDIYQEFVAFCLSHHLPVVTWIAKTFRGYHVYYVIDPGTIIKPVATVKTERGDFELRSGNKQYCVLPPSFRTKEAFTYSWQDGYSPQDRAPQRFTPQVQSIVRAFIEKYSYRVSSDEMSSQFYPLNQDCSRPTPDAPQDLPLCSINTKEVVNYYINTNEDTRWCFSPLAKSYFHRLIYDFNFLKTCFFIFGNRSDAANWELDQLIRCVFHEDHDPSAKFVRLERGEVGYREFHAPHTENRIATYAGYVAFFAHLFGVLPEAGRFGEKLGFLMRGIAGFCADWEEKGGTWTRYRKLDTILHTVKADDPYRELLLHAWRVIELFHHGRGDGEFFLSCRDLARCLKLITPKGSLNFGQANRILNLFCILGFLEKQPRESGQRMADQYQFSEPRTWLLEQLIPLPSLQQFNQKKAFLYVGSDASVIFRRSPSRKGKTMVSQSASNRFPNKEMKSSSSNETSNRITLNQDRKTNLDPGHEFILKRSQTLFPQKVTKTRESEETFESRRQEAQHKLSCYAELLALFKQGKLSEAEFIRLVEKINHLGGS
jgi:hypothetical protein